MRTAGWVILIIVGVPFAIAAALTTFAAISGGFVGGGIVLLVALAVGFVLSATGGALLIGFADLLDNVEQIRRNTESSPSRTPSPTVNRPTQSPRTPPVTGFSNPKAAPESILREAAPASKTDASDPDHDATAPLIRRRTGSYCGNCDHRLMMAKCGDECTVCGVTLT